MIEVRASRHVQRPNGDGGTMVDIRLPDEDGLCVQGAGVRRGRRMGTASCIARAGRKHGTAWVTVGHMCGRVMVRVCSQ